MPYRLSALIAFLATTSAVASLVWTHSSMDLRPNLKTTTSLASEESPTDALNRITQKRFHNISNTGFDRFPTIHQAVRNFAPETVLEKAVVANLEKTGRTVSIYLVGRETLASEPRPNEWTPGHPNHRREIDGPRFITGGTPTPPTDLPQEWELREHGRNALLNAASADSFTTTIGRWKIDARPVRADRQA